MQENVLSSSKKEIAVIVASGCEYTFATWMRTSFHELCKYDPVRIYVVPWGDEAKAITKLSENVKKISIINPHPQDNTLEGHRNIVLTRLRSGTPPDCVVFLDDDTYLNPSWTVSMLHAVNAGKEYNAFASLVFSEGMNCAQSAGHIFVKGGPRDRGYRGKDLERDILCPCGNSAVIRWCALENIWAIDDIVWDPLFKGNQTCFDFGLKLTLTGSKTLLVHWATAQHRGYLCRGESWKRDNAERIVLNQLASRYLLYMKYLPQEIEMLAIIETEKRLNKWKKEGYPGFREYVKGETIVIINDKAKKLAKDNAINYKTFPWRKYFNDSAKAKEIFDL